MAKRKNILIIHNYYKIPGGEDTVVMNEKNMLERNGNKVMLYSRHNCEISEMNIFKKILMIFQTIYSFKSKREIKKIIKENNIEVMHVHNTLPLISPSVYKAGKECNVKVIQTIHNFRLLCPAATFTRNGDICEDCVNMGLRCAIKNSCYRNSKVQTLICTLMLKFNRFIKSYDYVDKYIVLSEFNKNKMSKLINKEKMVVKPNFVENNNCRIVPASERKYFMFLGRLDKLKGINDLVKCWKEIDDEKLLIVGKGPEEENIRRFIDENNIANVELAGFKEKDEVMKLLSKAKALIVPSKCYEGFPMTIVEAMSVGTPLITSNIGNVKDVGKESIGNIQYNDISNWKQVIKRASLISVLQMEIDKARDKYEHIYSEEINYRILSNVYEN